MNWISIRKQKPPLDTPVLVFQRFQYGTEIQIAEFVIPPRKKLPKFAVNIRREKDGTVYHGFPAENVTHWMPLPEPPKRRKEEKR